MFLLDAGDTDNGFFGDFASTNFNGFGVRLTFFGDFLDFRCVLVFCGFDFFSESSSSDWLNCNVLLLLFYLW